MQDDLTSIRLTTRAAFLGMVLTILGGSSFLFASFLICGGLTLLRNGEGAAPSAIRWSRTRARECTGAAWRKSRRTMSPGIPADPLRLASSRRRFNGAAINWLAVKAAVINLAWFALIWANEAPHLRGYVSPWRLR